MVEWGQKRWDAMKKEYDNYIFDLYGTLVDIRTDEESPLFWERFCHYCRFLGMDCRANTLRDTYLRLCREAEEAMGVGQVEIDLAAVWPRLGAAFGQALTAEDCRRMALTFRALSLRRLGLYPGAAEVLDELRRRGKQVVLLSNAQRCFTEPELRSLGLYDRFDHVLLSSDVGVKKPSPAFFGLAAGLGCRAEDSLMVGNDPVCDCAGAAAVGMDSAFIHTAQSPKGRAIFPKNCRRIHSLRELL